MPGPMNKPLACAGCPLFGDGTGYSALEGDGRLPLMAIAEALGENEEEDALPLRPQGRAGSVFRRAIRELGVPANSLTITNIVRCRPPNNELWGQPYYYASVDHCRQYLRAAVRERQPRVLLALGDVPYHNLVANPVGQLTAIRGFILPSVYEGIPLVATYHPAHIARGAWDLFGAFKRDVKLAVDIARNGPPPQMEVQYELEPSVDRVRDYLFYLRRNTTLPISYDTESAGILGQPEPADWRKKEIIQIQFSHRPGYAIVLPYEGDYRLLAHAILALSNPKWGWNSRLSDDLALRADGAVLNGELHDLMNAWGHVQPSFWGNKEDYDTDKGVPSRLMGLQSCTSFYAPEVGPWKHLGTPAEIARDPKVLKFYGAKDADFNTRCGVGIFASLEAQGLMPGYLDHKLGMRPVLDWLGEVGIPVDRQKQSELAAYVRGELTALQTRIQSLVPPEVLSVHPKTGYKALGAVKLRVVENPYDETSTLPKTPLKAILESYDPSQPPLVEAAGHIGYLKWRPFPYTDTAGYPDVEKRWCIERLYNPHGSSPNTKSYIRARGYRMPKAVDSGLDTTGKNELQKLVKETGDEVLRLTGDWRELAKVGGDYAGGKWTPGEDGRVHATFKFGTAIAQLVATDPPVMTYPEHSGIAKRAKGCIVAQPGHVLVKVDKRGFHARAIGWWARDPVYYRLADFDVHSFITAHFLHLPEAPVLMDLSDAELDAVLKRIKSTEEHTRNYKVKRVVHGRQFGMRVKKLYQLHGTNFDPTPERMVELVGEARWYSWSPEKQRREITRYGWSEATNLFNLFDRLFPQTFVNFPLWVERQIREVSRCRLVTPFHHHRYFFDYDMQQATAYLPSSCAHCDFQAALVRMWEAGIPRHFEAINITHDALWLHPEERYAAECIEAVQYEFNLPSTIMVDNPLGPFQCNSDAEIGYSLDKMETWKG